jgi:hypothetical protein
MDNNKEGVNKSTRHEKKDRIGCDFKENFNTQCCPCKMLVITLTLMN